MNAITYSSLTHLLPNGIAQITKYSIEESTKINNRIDREKESKILAANQFLLTCIKGKCRRSINLLAPQTMKALNYNSKHIQSMHKNEAREPLEEEILIHSYISVTGTGRKKKYKDHFQLLKPINKSTFQYIKQPKKTLFTSLSNQPISYYDEIDLFKQKSSIPPKKSKQSKSSKTSSSTTSAPSASSAPTSLSPTKAISPLASDEKDIIRIDKKDFNKLINKIESLESKMDQMYKNNIQKIKTMDNYVININQQRNNSNESTKEKIKIKIPHAKGMTLSKFENGNGKHIFSIKYNAN